MSSPLTLYASPSPAASCVPVALEELDLQYNVKTLNMKEREQKSEWYLKINPNGRLPALIDHSKEDFVVWESSAILLYIAQHYDTEGKISYDPIKEPKLYSEQLQWIFFSHGGLAPMEGQAGHFLRLAPEDIPYAIKRYQDETRRLYSVLEERLKGREWLVGPHYSLADIKAFPWIRTALFSVEIDVGKEYPNLHNWLRRILDRPKTYKGIGVPERTDPDARAKLSKEETRAFGAALFGFKKVD